MPIKIDFLANTQSFLRGTEDIDGALDKVATSLDDMAADGGDGTKRLERDFKELADTVKSETDQAARSIKRNFSEGTSAAARDLGDLKRSAGSAFDGASEGAAEFKDEAKATAKETAASFDGSADSIADAFQEVAANAFIGFGPAGLVAGLAAAAGIGLISAAIQDGTEEGEKLRAKVGELTAELIEAGDVGGPSLDYLVDRLKQLATEAEDGETTLKDLREAADGSGRSFKDLAQVYAGNSDELDSLVKSNKELYDSLNDQAGAIDTTTNAGVKQYEAIQKRIVAQEQYNGYLNEAKTVADAAAESEANYAASGGPEMEAKAASISAINDAYDEAASAVQGFIDTETGIFDTTAYIAAMQEREQAIKNYHETIATSGLSPEAIAFLESQGLEMGAAMLAGYQSSAPESKAELNRLWTEAAQENSGQYLTGVTAALGGATVNGPTVRLPDPAAAASEWANGLQSNLNGTVLRVRVQGVGRNGERID